MWVASSPEGVRRYVICARYPCVVILATGSRRRQVFCGARLRCQSRVGNTPKSTACLQRNLASIGTAPQSHCKVVGRYRKDVPTALCNCRTIGTTQQSHYTQSHCVVVDDHGNTSLSHFIMEGRSRKHSSTALHNGKATAERSLNRSVPL